MAETVNLFKALWDAFNITPTKINEFALQNSGAKNFIHVRVEIDDMLEVGLATFTSYQGNLDGFSARPDYRMVVNAYAGLNGDNFKLTASDGLARMDDDEFVALAVAKSWEELALHFTRSEDTTYFQLGFLFLQLAGRETYTKFSLLLPALQAA